MPFTSLIEGTKVKDEAALREIFTAAGVRPGSEVVSYCHIGQQASLVWLAARILGYEARLYDGSFEDWSGREDLPVVNPAAAKPSRSDPARAGSCQDRTLEEEPCACRASSFRWC